MSKEPVISKQLGPLPVWGWGIVGFGSVFLFKHLFISGPNKESSDTAYTVAALNPPNTSGLYPDSDSYSPPGAFPIGMSNPLTTIGSQGGLFFPGLTPSTLPPSRPGGAANFIDPTTGRPVTSGPNGEGGWKWKPGEIINPGMLVWQMPDGRWAQYLPWQNIQNGNRVALGLTPDKSYTGTAPGANPAIVSQLVAA